MRSISASLIAGMTGATITVVGTPASDSCRNASSRRAGVDARGSITRASFGSSVVTDSATLAMLRFAMRDRMSRSRSTSVGLRDDADRMAEVLQHLQDPPHDLILLLDRLVRIGIGADRDGARRIFRIGQLALQKLRRLRLHEQLRLEVEAGRQAEIGVRRPREAIDAAVLAAAIGIDRAVERDVRRVVARDDLARRVDRHRGLERRQFFERLPAVVERDPRERLVAARGIRLRAATAAPLGVDRDGCIDRLVEIDRRRASGEAARRRWQGGRRRRRRAFQGCRRTSHGNDLIRHCEQNKNILAACW